MINLLPPELKSEYKFARRNTKLLHMLGGFGVGIVGLAVIVAAGFFYLQLSASQYKAQVEDLRQGLEEQNQAEISKEVQEISDRLKLAVDVLSNQVLYSEFLKQLATVTPSGVGLTSVNIAEYGGALDISAGALSYESATQLHVNLTDPENGIFESADIVNIGCNPGSEEQYPCTVAIRALFTKDNPFLLINDGATGAGQ